MAAQYPVGVEWAYVSWGHCMNCSDDDARLYRPKMTNTNLHVVMFPPICRKCLEGYYQGTVVRTLV